MNEDEDTSTLWESSAEHAVDSLLETAKFDEIRGVVLLKNYIPEQDRFVTIECQSLDEVQQVLTDAYDEIWYANAPFESGEPVFENDSFGYVGDAVADKGIEDFFQQFGGVSEDEDDPEPEPILLAGDLLTKLGSERLRVDVIDINAELIEYLAKHPKKMYDLQPRKFEELVAELFRSKGYEVELTPRTRDGGLDIVAIRKDELGAALTIIECKRFAPENKVGVAIVRGLYGVVEEKRATKGLVVTTSYFTRDAKTFHDKLNYRLGLADYDGMCRFLEEWRSRKT